MKIIRVSETITKTMKNALTQLLVYDSDTLYGVYTPGGISIDELTLACAFCRTMETVKNIILAGNNIGPDAADPICWCLTNKSVLAVDLSNNPLTDKLVRQIGKIIRMQNEVLMFSLDVVIVRTPILSSIFFSPNFSTSGFLVDSMVLH